MERSRRFLVMAISEWRCDNGHPVCLFIVSPEDLLHGRRFATYPEMLLGFDDGLYSLTEYEQTTGNNDVYHFGFLIQTQSFPGITTARAILKEGGTAPIWERGCNSVS